MTQDLKPSSPALAQSKWGALAIVFLGVVMSTLDTTIVNVALPTIGEDFGITLAEVSWVALSYSMVIALCVIPCGRIADRLGYRFMYCAGFFVFTLGSVLCGFASNLYVLSFARAIQALGGAAILANSGALLVLTFPAEQRGRALGSIPLAVAIGISSGPVLGGILTQHIGWPWIFFVNIPIGIAGAGLALKVLKPVSREQRQTFQAFKFSNLFFLALALAGFVLGVGLAEWPDKSWSSPEILFLLLLSGFCFCLFLIKERKTKFPLIPFELLKNQVFMASMLAGSVSLIMVSGMLYQMNFQMQVIQGFSKQTTGFILLTSPLCLSLFGPFSGWMSDRFGGGFPRFLGIFSATAGIISMAFLQPEDGPWQMVWRVALFGSGMGLFQTPNNHLTFNAAPSHIIGAASGFITAVRAFGMLVGTLAATLVLSGFLGWYLEEAPPAIEKLKVSAQSVQAFRASFAVMSGLGGLMLGFALWAHYKQRVLKAKA